MKQHVFLIGCGDELSNMYARLYAATNKANSLLRQAKRTRHYWPFVRGIHRVLPIGYQ